MGGNNMKRLLIGVGLMLVSTGIFAANVVHTGVIKNIYFNDTAHYAIRFHTPFDAAAIMECSSFNGFAGGRTTHVFANPSFGTNFDRADHLQDLLLDAYKNQTPITIVTNGCTASDSWLHIRSAIGTAPPPP